MPRMRGRLYSSCASSTWSFPSALTACWAKMSRISCVRSITRDLSASSRNRCCTRVDLAVDEQALGVGVLEARFELLELPLADVGPLRGPAAMLDDAADG